MAEANPRNLGIFRHRKETVACLMIHSGFRDLRETLPTVVGSELKNQKMKHCYFYIS